MTDADRDSGPLHVWQTALQAGRFQLQRCDACTQAVFYPRIMCPHCGAESLRWVSATGGGTVHSVTVVARREAQGGPYNVVLVDLDEGVRLMSRVEGMAPEDVAIGLRVQHDIVSDHGQAVLVFRPAA